MREVRIQKFSGQGYQVLERLYRKFRDGLRAAKGEGLGGLRDYGGRSKLADGRKDEFHSC